MLTWFSVRKVLFLNYLPFFYIEKENYNVANNELIGIEAEISVSILNS